MAMLDRIRTRTGSDLSDDELQAMIDGVGAELDARLGPIGPLLLRIGAIVDPQSRYLRSLRLTRPIDLDEAVQVVEVTPGNAGGAAARTVLSSDDYRIQHGGRTLVRLIDGPNGAEFWAPQVEISYTPITDQAARDEALIKLVTLDLSYRGGLKSERAGDYQFTLSTDPAADREAIFAALAPKGGMVMA